MFTAKRVVRSLNCRSFVPGFIIVPHQYAVVIERFGKFYKTLQPGFHLLIPFVDRDAYYHSLKEEVYQISSQAAVTKDNVTIQLDGVLYLKIVDPFKASYGVGDPISAMTQLAQTTMRSELGKLTLDKTFEEREHLNNAIVDAINDAAEDWGIVCMRYEIRDITPPLNIRKAMELQAEAERQRRADVLTSEGKKLSSINISEGQRQAAILAAEGEAQATIVKAKAIADGVSVLAKNSKESGGHNAIKLRLAEQYIEAFSSLGKSDNTMIIPAQPHDASKMVDKALGIFDDIGLKK
mmetsp:Transcript_17773/g.17745  ORF Transcript_17773/g.17745 Transcript_17773/m.17745 type:complete len:295 (-) Transcript_17773:19-903(-)